MKFLNQQLKTTKELEEKDMKHFDVKFTLGNYENQETGIGLKTRFGIVDNQSKNINDIRETMGFANPKESWFLIKIHVEGNPEELVKKIKTFKFWRLLERYVKIYNKKETQNQAKLLINFNNADKLVMIGL